MTALATLVKHYATPITPDAEGIWYLASPYTSEDPAQTETWVQEMRDLIPRFINAYPKIVPLVPVICTDPLAGHCEPTGGWYAFGLKLLDTAQGFIVVTQEGWEHSRGIMLELGFARAKGIPIATFDPNCVTAEVEITVDDDSETEHGLAESDILDQMEKCVLCTRGTRIGVKRNYERKPSISLRTIYPPDVAQTFSLCSLVTPYKEDRGARVPLYYS